MPTTPHARRVSRLARPAVRLLAVLAATAVGLVLAAMPALATEGGSAGSGDENLWRGAILAGVVGVVVGALVSVTSEAGTGSAEHAEASAAH